MIDQILDRHFPAIASIAANVGIDTAAKLPAANITVITSTRNLNKSKAIVDGNIKTVGFGTLSEGCFETKSLNINQLHQLINCISINTALCNGTVKPEYKHVEAITTSNNLTKKEFADGVNTIARSKDYFEYTKQAGWLFIDCDRPDLTLAQCYSLLIFLMPELRTAPTIGVTSSSAGIYNVTAPPPVDVFGGAHFYILIDDATLIPTIGQIINYRCWLNPKVSGIDLGISADFKFATVSVKPNGTIKKSSLFDSCVYQAERLIYEAAPTLSNDLARKERVFAKINSDTEALNTNSFYFSDTQQLELDAIIDAAMLSVKTESDKLKSIVKREQKSQLISSGHTELEAEIIVKARENDILSGNMMLKPDNAPAISVTDILKDGADKWHFWTFANPDNLAESCKAQLYFNDDGTVKLHSFANYGCNYDLVNYSCIGQFLALKKIKANPKKDYLSQQLDEIAVAQNTQLHALWTKLAEYLANKVPQKFTLEQTVGIIDKAMSARDFDVKNAATVLITNKVNANKEKMRLLHLLPQGTLEAFNIKSHDVTGMSVDEVALKMRDMFLKNPTMFIDNRGMGYGKTNTLAALGKLLDVNIIYVTHRTTLVAQSATRLSFTSYDDMSSTRYSFSKDVNLAVCVNSLFKYDTRKATVVFVDEARQVFETVVGCSTMQYRSHQCNNFTDLLKRADMVVLSDAGMNSSALEFYAECANHKEIVHITADAMVDSKTYKWLPNHDTTRHKALEHLKRGECCVIASTSSEQAERTEKFFISNDIPKNRLMLITGTTSKYTDDSEVAKFLSNPNQYVDDYDCIIYTPAVVSGFSLEHPKFNHTYFLCSKVLPANESMQMMARNRCATDIFVSLGIDNNKEKLVTDRRILRKGQAAKLKRLADGLGLDGLTIDTITPNLLGEWQIDLLASTNYDLNNFARSFMLLCELEGKNFVNADADKFIERGTKEIVKQEKLKGILSAENISAEEYNQLEKKGCTSKKDTFAFQRFEVLKMKGLIKYDAKGNCEVDVNNVGIDDNDIENYLSGMMIKLRNFENLHKKTQELRKIDKTNFESKNSLRSLVSRQSLIMPWIEKLTDVDKKLRHLKIDEKTNLIKFGKKEISEFVKHLKNNHAELSEFGNFNRDFKSDAKVMAALLTKFGFELECVSRTENERFYSIKINADVLAYATEHKA